MTREFKLSSAMHELMLKELMMLLSSISPSSSFYYFIYFFDLEFELLPFLEPFVYLLEFKVILYNFEAPPAPIKSPTGPRDGSFGMESIGS